MTHSAGAHRLARIGLAVCLAALFAFPSPAPARSDGSWRAILVEAGGLWWEEFSDYCHLNQFRPISGSRQFDGRIGRTRYFRNPFTRRCRRSEGYVQGTSAVWAVRRGVLRMYFVFTGRVTVDTVRLLSYSRRPDVLSVSRRGARQPWYGCGSTFNPFNCL